MGKFLERHKTRYAGVFYIDGRKGRIFYIRYSRAGRQIEEKCGHASIDGMTAAKANDVRVARLRGEQPSNAQRRATDRWTIEALWEEYRQHKGKAHDKPVYADRQYADADYFNYQHIKEPFGSKTPAEITAIEIARFTAAESEKYKPQTVKHGLTLLVRLVRFGWRHQLCQPFSFIVDYPRFNNETDNRLSRDDVRRLVTVLDNDPNRRAAVFVVVALLTGMRKGAILKLRWDDIDTDRQLILLRQPKARAVGAVERIPLPPLLMSFLDEIRPAADDPAPSEYVFPNKKGQPLTDGKRPWQRIRKAAGLDGRGFRFHDIRHHYGNTLTSKGISPVVLQKLLTHKDPAMTARYARPDDESMRAGAAVAGNTIVEILEVREPAPQPDPLPEDFSDMWGVEMIKE